MTDNRTETRTVSATGGEKGAKIERFDLVPTGPLRDLAAHYGVGAHKYADRNWERGYPWSLSYAALSRHLNLWWSGEDYDPDVPPAALRALGLDPDDFMPSDVPGQHHLVAVAWHAFALLEYARTHVEFDDRPSTMDAEVDADLDPAEDTDYAVAWLAEAEDDATLLARARAVRFAVNMPPEPHEPTPAEVRREAQAERIREGAKEFFGPAPELPMPIAGIVSLPGEQPEQFRRVDFSKFQLSREEVEGPVESAPSLTETQPAPAPGQEQLRLVDYRGLTVSREEVEGSVEPLPSLGQVVADAFDAIDWDEHNEKLSRAAGSQSENLRRAVQMGLDRDQR